MISRGPSDRAFCATYGGLKGVLSAARARAFSHMKGWEEVRAAPGKMRLKRLWRFTP